MPDNQEDWFIDLNGIIHNVIAPFLWLLAWRYRLENSSDTSFDNSIKEMGKVDRLYRLDLRK